MRVLMTGDTVGGVWTYALSLARTLGESSVQVFLATMGSPLSANQAREAAAIPNLTVFSSEYALEWMESPWEEVDAAGEWLLQLTQELDPDLIHLNGYSHACLPFERPVIVVAHSCVLSWWRAVKGTEAPPTWDEYRRRVGDGLGAADAVVAPTRAILEEVVRPFPDLPTPCRVIPNGCAMGRSRARAREPFVLSAGRLWDEAKNLCALNACASRLPWPVRVAGPRRGPVGDEVSGNNLEFLGYLAPAVLHGWMSRASIFALPARYEPFGLSALEAAWCGCALVLGDIPTLREIWGDAACFVPPDNHEQLGAVLKELCTNPEKLDRLARRARSRARAFTASAMGRAYDALYRQLTPSRLSGIA